MRLCDVGSGRGRGGVACRRRGSELAESLYGADAAPQLEQCMEQTVMMPQFLKRRILDTIEILLAHEKTTVDIRDEAGVAAGDHAVNDLSIPSSSMRTKESKSEACSKPLGSRILLLETITYISEPAANFCF